VTGPVMADSEEEARETLNLLDLCKVRHKTVMHQTNVSIELDRLLQDAEDLLYPPGRTTQPTTCGPTQPQTHYCRERAGLLKRCRPRRRT